MASLGQWISGARPRTLPNAVAPVIAGTGAAAWLHAAVWWKALLALAVALAMVIGFEPLLVARDTRGLSSAEAAAVSTWAARALLRAALEEADA